MDLTVETFQAEIGEAMKAYERFIVCIDKTPDDCKATLVSLMDKAIRAYVSRGPHLRHGIALDKQVTIILSRRNTSVRCAGSISIFTRPTNAKPPPPKLARRTDAPPARRFCPS